MLVIGAPEAEPAHPRALIGGHIISTLVGLLVLKLTGPQGWAAATAVGLAVLLTCIVSFATRGRGTLSPADPTKKLVISGLYRFSRNPMYIGVTMMLLGESIFFRSYVLGAYTLFIFIAFNIFIIFFEEPRLQDDFGSEYNQYTQKVRRWL